MTETDVETVTGEVTQVIPPEEQSRFALNDRTRALAADGDLTTLDTRERSSGVRLKVKRFVEWLQNPTGTVDGVYHAVFEDSPPEGSEISVTLEPLAPDLWEATEYHELKSDGGLTESCPECDGAGEFVEVERDGRIEAVKGVTAMNRIRDGGWTYHGVRECTKCKGYGHVDARTGEI